MSNEKQIEEMAKDLIQSFCVDFDMEAERHEINFMAQAEHLYSAGYRKQEWISVEDRLPEENGRYLACVKISHLAFDIPPMVVIMGYNKIHGFDTISGEETVTHWMPLPEAPKMKGGAE